MYINIDIDRDIDVQADIDQLMRMCMDKNHLILFESCWRGRPPLENKGAGLAHTQTYCRLDDRIQSPPPQKASIQ